MISFIDKVKTVSRAQNPVGLGTGGSGKPDLKVFSPLFFARLGGLQFLGNPVPHLARRKFF